MVYTKLNFSRGYPHGVIINKKGQIVKVGTMKSVKGDKSLEKVFLELEK